MSVGPEHGHDSLPDEPLAADHGDGGSVGREGLRDPVDAFGGRAGGVGGPALEQGVDVLRRVHAVHDGGQVARRGELHDDRARGGVRVVALQDLAKLATADAGRQDDVVRPEAEVLEALDLLSGGDPGSFQADPPVGRVGGGRSEADDRHLHAGRLQAGR
ncbi:hypothetical protein IPZ64_19720 [Streptomyces violaceoruber]|nr:hypothetical protein [Streptomyces violaceoruber]MCF3169139.1 hypothetical protein [Streptomyces violaceoruber]